MKSLIVFVSLFLAANALASEREFTHYDAAMSLIVARNQGHVCEENAYQDTIIENVLRGSIDDPIGLQTFVQNIPANSDILQNLFFKTVIANVDLLAITDSNKFTELLTNTTYYARSSSAVGSPYVVELKPNGKAHIHQRIAINNGYKIANIKATWKANVEIEPGADYYQFVRVTLKDGTVLDYLLKSDVSGNYLFENAATKDENQKIILFSPPASILCKRAKLN
jgi:hypothetical protein